MQPDKETMIRLSLEKSQQALKSARLNIDNDLLTDSQNRIYYAIFYAVLALGYLDGFITGKHKELKGWFNRKYIYENKVFNHDLLKLYNRVYKDRMLYDYTVYEAPDKDKLEEDLKDTTSFINILTKYILNQLDETR